jgi:hypothetical protein
VAPSIHTFVERHRGRSREDAYRLLREEPDVSAAIARSPDVESRIQEEFERAWSLVSSNPSEGIPVESLDGVIDFDSLAEIPDDLPDLPEAVAPEPARETAPAGTKYLCPGCGEHALASNVTRGGLAHLRCPGCSWATSDVLSLIPIREAGPLAYLAGDGWRGLAAAGAYTAILSGLFLALRWMRV